MRALAHRITHLNTEIADHDRAMTTLLQQIAPQLLDQAGIGRVTAATFVLAWSHSGPVPHRSCVRSTRRRRPHPSDIGSNPEPSPPQSSRRPTPQPHAAAWFALTRLQRDPATRAYMSRRLAEGKTKLEVACCLRRYIARRVWRLLEHQSPPALTS